MKKIIALILALLMLLSFAACSAYEGGAKYAISIDEQTEIPALSNVLKSTQVPRKLTFSVQNKSYDKSKFIGAGNYPKNYVTKSIICSLSELAKIEESTLPVYEYKSYNDTELKEFVSGCQEDFYYYFMTRDFDELAKIVKAYADKYCQGEYLYKNFIYIEGSYCSLRCVLTKSLSELNVFVGRDDDGQLYVGVNLRKQLDTSH